MPLTQRQLDAVERLVVADIHRGSWSTPRDGEALSAHVDLKHAFGLPTRGSQSGEAEGGFRAMWNAAFPKPGETWCASCRAGTCGAHRAKRDVEAELATEREDPEHPFEGTVTVEGY
jgi:hypothetical protein